MNAGFVCTAGEMNRISFVCQQFVILAYSSSNKSAYWKEGFCMPDHRLEKIREEHLADVLRIYNHYVLHSTATFHAQALTLRKCGSWSFSPNHAIKPLYCWSMNDAPVMPMSVRTKTATPTRRPERSASICSRGLKAKALASWLSHTLRSTRANTIFMSCWRRSAAKTPTVSSCS